MSEIVLIKENKSGHLPLLLRADPSEEMIERYLARGEMYLLCDGAVPCCVAVVTEEEYDVCELKNLATEETCEHRGYASKLVRYLLERYHERGARRMLVGTSVNGVSFYEQFGFTFSHIERHFFTKNYPEPIVENGNLCDDMIYLSIDL